MNNNNRQNTTINWYPGHMAKTKREIKERMNLIDVIYEVIDARMPISSKIKDMDEILKDKPRILIMTKKDLCDIKVTNKWVEEYKHQGYNICIMDLTNNEDYKKLISLTNEVTKDIQEKRKDKGLKNKEIKVGVIGIPNVGKSTLINKLAGRTVAKTGNKPGVTKQINWLKTNVGLLLLDTPGILWSKLDNELEALILASTATIKNEILNMSDIGAFILEFLNEHYPSILNDIYGINKQENYMDIFAFLAQKYHYYESDGEIDYEKISIKIYNDLISGKIKGVTFDL